MSSPATEPSRLRPVEVTMPETGQTLREGASLAEIVAPAPAAEPEEQPEPLPEPEPEPPPPQPPVDLAGFRSPAVRRLAATHAIALDGSGRDGRVTRNDILRSVARDA